jgi:hypothetical protein
LRAAEPRQAQGPLRGGANSTFLGLWVNYTNGSTSESGDWGIYLNWGYLVWLNSLFRAVPRPCLAKHYRDRQIYPSLISIYSLV